MYQYLDLPQVPDDLLLSLDKVLQLENIFEYKDKTDVYTIHPCQTALTEYLKTVFPKHTKFRYHTLTDELPIHVDIGRSQAINYIIDAGGSDVKTTWYKDDKTTKILEKVFKPNCWHSIKTDIHHGVSNIKTRRYAITVG
jgi:hypothetical protein